MPTEVAHWPEWLNAEPNEDHPAKFSPQILDAINLVIATEPHMHVLDPFAGIGGIHQLDHITYAIELEPEWAVVAARHGRTTSADFLTWNPDDDPFWQVTGGSGYFFDPPERFGAIVTSPTYGNRMADAHLQSAADKSKRLTYRHRLGRQLTDNNSGGMQWGDGYKVFHWNAWRRVRELLEPEGLFILNVKDHVRKKQIQQVAKWHREVLTALGFHMVNDIHVPVKGMGFGANQQTLKLDYEHVMVFEKAGKQ